MANSHEVAFFVVFDAEVGGPQHKPWVRKLRAKRLTAKPPTLAGGEIALKFSAAIPDSAFLRLIPDVSVVIPDGWWTSQPVQVEPALPPAE